MQLPLGQTCQVFRGETLLFSSESHWLHPLFELERFLSSHPDFKAPSNRGDLFLKDRIIGRGAALIIIHLGIKQCSAPFVSSRALPLFDKFKITCDYQEVVPRLPCQTEDILMDIEDPAQAWIILETRAKAAKEAQR